MYFSFFFITSFFILFELFLVFRNNSELTEFLYTYALSFAIYIPLLFIVFLILKFIYKHLFNFFKLKKYYSTVTLSSLIFTNFFVFFIINSIIDDYGFNFIISPFGTKNFLHNFLIYFISSIFLAQLISIIKNKISFKKLFVSTFAFFLYSYFLSTFQTFINHKYIGSYLSLSGLIINAILLVLSLFLIFIILNSILSKPIKLKFYYLLIFIVFLLILSPLCFINKSIPKLKLQQKKFNKTVILITIDTLRHDYFYERQNKTRYIKSFVNDSLHFKNAYSTSSWTSPAIASMLGGKLASELGYNGITSILPNNKNLLPVILSNNNIKTGAVITNRLITGFFNFRQGFKSNDYSGVNSKQYYYKNAVWYKIYKKNFKQENQEIGFNSAEDAVDKSLRWLNRQTQKNIFFWLHLIDPHDPYSPEKKFLKPPPKNYTGPFLNDSGRINPHLMFGFTFSKEDIDRLKSLYQSEIDYTLFHLENFFSALKKMNLYKNSLIILTADHGEEFFDHNTIYHGHTFYNELVKIPFIVKLPNNKNSGDNLNQTISLTDIYPTVLDFFNIRQNHTKNNSYNLFQFINKKNNNKNIPRTLFFENTLGIGKKNAILENNYKLIYNIFSKTKELYNINDDCLEKYNIAAKNKKLTEQLFLKLKLKFNNFKQKKSEYKIGPKHMAILKNLGYIQ